MKTKAKVKSTRCFYLDAVTSATAIQSILCHVKALDIFVEVYMFWNPRPTVDLRYKDLVRYHLCVFFQLPKWEISYIDSSSLRREACKTGISCQLVYRLFHIMNLNTVNFFWFDRPDLCINN